MARFQRKRYQHGHAVPTVSLTPLIDTALTLLVVFMVTAPVAHRSIRVDLPRTTASSEQPQQIAELSITINHQEALFCDDVPMTRATCAEVCAERIRRLHGPVQVYLRVDRRASSGIAVEVLGILRALEGVQCVAFDIDDRSVRSK